MIQAVVGIPYVHYFMPSGTPSTYVLIGPDFQISKSTCLGTPIADAINGGYVITITPNEPGVYALVVKASGGSVVHQEQFEAVFTSLNEVALGLELPQHQLISLFAPTTFVDVNTIIRNGGAEGIVCYASKGKQVVPMDGYVYGLSLYVYAASDYPGLVSIKFATVDPVTGKVRGISENWKARTMTDDAWNELKFDKPVLAKAGDWIVFEVNDANANLFTVGVNNPVASLSAIQIIEARYGALDLVGSNTFSVSMGPPLSFNVKLLMAPPHIAIAGHSVYSGYPGGTSFYDPGRAYSRTYDLAAMLGERLGVRALNVSYSSQNITSYVLDGGFFDTFLDEIYPSVLLFDTVASDFPITNADYVVMLDRLMAQCMLRDIELIMMEGAPMGSVISTDPPSITSMRDKRAIVHEWCQHHGIPCIPMEFLLGSHSGGIEHLSQRNTQKVLTNPTVNYAPVGDGTVHLSLQGIKAAANGLANCFRNRRNIEVRTLRNPSMLDQVRPVQIIDNIRVASELSAINTQS